ncbi:MAG: PP2C family protein-serine/threonine phosphatase [Anaerolineales bacterium]
MSENIFQRIQRSVQEKHRHVEDWLENAPEPELDCCLASEDAQPVQEHLQVLEEVLEKADAQTLGICELCHGHVEESVLEIDYTASVCLDCLSETERRNLETELEFSSEVQRALLPQQVPSIPGLDIAAFSRPAQIVGGDYFDFFQFRDSSYGLVIADVMGHGVSASLLMSSLQTALHTLIPDNDSASEVIQRVNRYYLHNVNLTTFVTAFLGQFDPGRGVLAYCNAGHNPPLFYQAQPDGKGETSWLMPTGAAIGLVEEYKLRLEEVTLRSGDIVLLYTDGMTEATNPLGEEFGRERLAELLTRNADRSSRDVVSALRTGLNDFIAGAALADDVTMVVCKFLG